MMFVSLADDLGQGSNDGSFASCPDTQTSLMNSCEKIPGDCIYSENSVNEHLGKLLIDPLFSLSDILKRFLRFIVKETLEGRSDQLKEYTIGVKVLHKPANFNPQIDAIVRIHACRLR